MKTDLKMRLGDRKRLMNYINYLSNLTKPKKGLQKKNSKNIPKRNSFRTQTSSMKKAIMSVAHNRIEEQIDEEWKESEEALLHEDDLKKKKNFVTEDWDIYNSNAYELYKSEVVTERKSEDKQSKLSEKRSDSERED